MFRFQYFEKILAAKKTLTKNWFIMNMICLHTNMTINVKLPITCFFVYGKNYFLLYLVQWKNKNLNIIMHY